MYIESFLIFFERNKRRLENCSSQKNAAGQKKENQFHQRAKKKKNDNRSRERQRDSKYVNEPTRKGAIVEAVRMEFNDVLERAAGEKNISREVVKR